MKSPTKKTGPFEVLVTHTDLKFIHLFTPNDKNVVFIHAIMLYIGRIALTSVREFLRVFSFWQ